VWLPQWQLERPVLRTCRSRQVFNPGTLPKDIFYSVCSLGV
jgi:hypothetical protein